jgi:hypothetical protein
MSNILQKIVKTALFPTTHIKGDWYKTKGYEGFDDYLTKQRTDVKAPLNSVLNDVDIQREFVKSYNTKGKENQLEAVTIKMKDNVEGLPYDKEALAGNGKHIIDFLGRSEYYQYDLRDLSVEALKTGATVHAFNYSGMYASTGEAEVFEDLVNDGMAMVSNLIQKGVKPDEIILKGNCLGSAVAEAVARKAKEELGVEIRQINSNSFKSIKSVICNTYPILQYIEKFIAKILAYTGWEIKPGKNLETTSPYKCYMHRPGDKTIAEPAKMHTKLEKYNKENKPITQVKYDGYDEAKQKFDDNAAMIEAKEWTKEDWSKHYKTEWLPKDKNGNVVSGTKYDDPHELHLYQVISEKSRSEHPDKDITTMFDFINDYIKESDKYIAQHQQPAIEKLDQEKLCKMSMKKQNTVYVSKNEQAEMNLATSIICGAVIEDLQQKQQNDENQENIKNQIADLQKLNDNLKQQQNNVNI